MENWVLFSILAASAQTIRFALQKSIASKDLTVAAATWARFFWSWPVAAMLVFVYAAYQDIEIPPLTLSFFVFGIAGGVFQILATACTVYLFSLRAFAVGITFKKTEVILTAIVGYLILGDRISLWGTVAIFVGLIGVLLLSKTSPRQSVFNKAAGVGLLSGVLFALAAVTYRGAVQQLHSDNPVFVAGITLAVVSFWQTLGLGIWILIREPGQVRATLNSWRQTSLVSLFSLIGSGSWFAAFSLMNAAYVFAVGQIELIFSAIIGALWFGDRLTKREFLGMAILLISILTLAFLGAGEADS